MDGCARIKSRQRAKHIEYTMPRVAGGEASIPMLMNRVKVDLQYPPFALNFAATIMYCYRPVDGPYQVGRSATVRALRRTGYWIPGCLFVHLSIQDEEWRLAGRRRGLDLIWLQHDP